MYFGQYGSIGIRLYGKKRPLYLEVEDGSAIKLMGLDEGLQRDCLSALVEFNDQLGNQGT